MKILLFILVCAVLACLTLTQAISQPLRQDSLTVEQTIRIVLEHHPMVQQSLSNVRAAEARVMESESDYYPSANTEFSYTRLGPVATLAVPGLGAFKLYPENNYDAHLAIHQKVFDFGRRSASVDLAQASVQLANDNVKAVQTNLAFQTITSFYTILFLQRSVQVQQQQIDALNEHLQITRKRVQSGTATDFDVLTTQVRVAVASSALIDLQTRQRQEELTLRRLLNFPDTLALNLRGEFSLLPIALNEDSLIAAGLQHRVDLHSARDAEMNAQLKQRVAALGNSPSINLNLTYGFKNGYIPNLDVLRGNWVAGAQVEIPIFDGHRTSNRVQEAEASLHSAQEHTTDVEQEVSLEVRQAIESLRSTISQLQNSELEVQQAQAAVGNARVRYETGVVTNLDLLDAEAALAQAHLRNLEVLYHFVLDRYGLERAVGTLIK